MPVSSTIAKKEMIEWIKSKVGKNDWILDVGPGCGTYADLLIKENFNNIDAVEVYEPYIRDYKLVTKYFKVFNEDIRTFEPEKPYKLLILGDVLEHLPQKDARALLDKWEKIAEHIIISVPYNNIQGEYKGNVYETHHQPDLNKEVFKERYPEFECIAEGFDPVYKARGVQYDDIGAWVWSKS